MNKVTLWKFFGFMNVCQNCYEDFMKTNPEPVDSYQVPYFTCEQCKKHICGECK